MANNETSFKKEFRDTTKAVYGTRVHMWNTTDLFVSGIPDTMVTFDGISIGWEAKFIKGLPQRDTSKLLTHVVSGTQMTFLENNVLAGGVGLVVVGSPDDALFLPVKYFDRKTGNISKAEFLAAIDNGDTVRVQKIKRSGMWQVEGLLEHLIEMYRNRRLG